MVAGSDDDTDNEYSNHDLALSVANCKDIDRATAEAFAMLSVASSPSCPAHHAPGGFTSAQRQHSSPREAAMRREPQPALLDAGPLHHPICEGLLGILVEVNGKKIYRLEEACETGITDRWYKAAAATQFYRGAKFHSSPAEEKKYDSTAALTCRYGEGEKKYVIYCGLAPGPGVYATWPEVVAMCIGISGSCYQKALSEVMAREYLEDACAIRGFVATLPPTAKLEHTSYLPSSIGINMFEDHQGPRDASSLSSPTSGELCEEHGFYVEQSSSCHHKWYAVFRGTAPGVFSSEVTAKRMTSGHPIGFFKEFDMEEDAVGEFILAHSLGHIVALA
ncbi:hypothetical protein BKA93DRAFT_827153 [Sparassis latifolia]